MRVPQPAVPAGSGAMVVLARSLVRQWKVAVAGGRQETSLHAVEVRGALLKPLVPLAGAVAS